VDAFLMAVAASRATVRAVPAAPAPWRFMVDLDPDLAAGLRRELVARWTHTSTAIEGNTLTLADTMFVLSEGLTVAGKSLAEHAEVQCR
jgi:hypothetical protein